VSQDEPGTDLAASLIRLSFLVQSVFARTAERHELTPVQAKLLCVLAGGPRGMAELAGLLGVEKAALTGLVDRAERRGLARRCPVPGDRRAFQVTLTPAGRTAAGAFHAEVCGQMRELAAGLGPAEAGRFARSLAQVVSARDGLPMFAVLPDR
jgi:DNA-binding MarR family transcriptional regulator